MAETPNSSNPSDLAGPRLFISHANSDASFIERELVPWLHQHGIGTWYSKENIRSGEQWEQSIRAGLNSCDWFLLVMSPRSLASKWVIREVRWALKHRPARIIPLLLESTDEDDWPLGLFDHQGVDYCSDRAEARSRLLATFGLPEQDANPAHPRQGEPDGVPDSLRVRPFRFIGRERECQLVLETLRNVSGLRTVCIDGLGGIGKTALAEEVVRRALAEGSITGMCWKTAKTERLVGPHLKRLSDDPLAWRTTRTDFLRARNERRGEQLLFVLDNLETTEGVEELLTEFPSVVGGHAGLLTSRERLHWHQEIRSVSLAGLTEKESIEFLRSDAQARCIRAVAGAPDRELRRVASALEGNPLAMRLVVSLCTYLPLDSIMDDLREAKLDRRFKGGSLYAFIYLRAWERLTELARAVLIYVGKTARESIGLKEVKDIFQRMGSGERETEDAVAQLVQLCLLDPNDELRADRRRFSVHALTRSFVNTELPELWNRNHP